ncbi:MAG: hypothetical protein HXX09_08535 [Bacteroidetes bacterium]|nr:hypothetical protein [Bacteroidota bacterium]
MKLDIIRDNIFYKIKNIAFFLGIAFLFVTILFGTIDFFEHSFLKWITLSLVGVYIVLAIFIDLHDVRGNLKIFKSGEIIIDLDNNKRTTLIDTISFYYGGYNGASQSLEVLFTGSWTKDGTKNYLVINGEKYQILLENEEELLKLNSIIKELRSLDIFNEFGCKDFLDL